MTLVVGKEEKCMKRIPDYMCSDCGSEYVPVDGPIEYDTKSKKWEVTYVGKTHQCSECGSKNITYGY